MISVLFLFLAISFREWVDRSGKMAHFPSFNCLPSEYEHFVFSLCFLLLISVVSLSVDGVDVK